MSDPYVREVGTVTGNDGYRAVVGVNYDAVTLAVEGSSGPLARHLNLTRDQAEEFAHLFVAACWEAGENKRQMGEEVHEADGGDSMAGCDAVKAGWAGETGVWECTETGPHTVHVARNAISGTVMHAWEDPPQGGGKRIASTAGFVAPVETGGPWRGPAQADWDGSRDG